MQNVILVVHIFACVAMTIVVLLQRSEGGALGIGGGGGLMSGRGAAGAMVRTTMLFGGIFFITSLALTTIASRGDDTRTEVERALDEDAAGVTVPTDALDTTEPLFADPLDETSNAPVTPVPDETADPLADPLADAPRD